MTAKQYLKQIKAIDGRIRRLKDRINTLRMTSDGLKAVSYDKDKVQTTPIDSMAETISEIIDLERQTHIEILKLETLKSKATLMIHSINYSEGEDVLYLRWIQGMNFYDISDTIGYSLPHTHRIHGKALQLLNEKMIQNDT